MPFTYICDYCGSSHTILQRARSERRYCSRSCYHAASRKVPDNACSHCGTMFNPRTLNNSRKYCSLKCANAAIVKRHMIPCARCGKLFHTPSLGEQRRLYCSEACYRPPQFIQCRRCGKTIRKLPSSLSHQFCSTSCYRAFVGETMPEANVRIALASLGIEFVQEFGVGRLSLDFALPELRIDIEVDGDYWHRDRAKDIRRDARLRAKGWTIVRLQESEVATAENLPAMILSRIGAFL